MPPKLSVITICYNAPRLTATCDSILAQTFRDFEWIVIDGGSGPETQHIWDKYKAHITRFVSEPDTGIYNAMNKGIRLARGTYVCFMNAGDSFHDSAVFSDIFGGAMPTADVVYGDACYLKKWGSKIAHYPDRADLIYFINRSINHQASFIRRDLFTKYGLYDESYKNAGDYDKWLCFAKNGATFQHTDRVVADFLMGGRSSDKKHTTEAETECLRALTTHIKPALLARYRWPGVQYHFWDRIFSVKTDRKRTHKIIAILGIRFKVRYNNTKG